MISCMGKETQKFFPAFPYCNAYLIMAEFSLLQLTAKSASTV